MTTETDRLESEQAELRRVLERNTEAIAKLRSSEHMRVSRQTRLCARGAKLLGRAAVLYSVAALSLAWVALNLALPMFGLRVLDAPPFFWLQGVVGGAALLASLMVLVGQNRQDLIAEHRAELDLQVNLLAEQRTAKLIALVEELRRDLPNVRDRGDPEAAALTRAADPVVVASMVEEALEEVEEGWAEPRPHRLHFGHRLAHSVRFDGPPASGPPTAPHGR